MIVPSGVTPTLVVRGTVLHVDGLPTGGVL